MKLETKLRHRSVSDDRGEAAVWKEARRLNKRNQCPQCRRLVARLVLQFHEARRHKFLCQRCSP